MRKILIPVDFTDKSYNASDFALLLAEAIGAEIQFLHCFSDMLAASESSFENIQDEQLQARLRKNETESKINLQKLHDAYVDQVQRERKRNVELIYSLVWGAPDDKIPEVGKSYKPDVIIMGNRNSGTFLKNLLGNVTESVVNKVDSPVLVIPERYRIKSIDEIRNMMYVTDFDNSDIPAIRHLIRLMAPFQINIKFVHVSSVGQSGKDQQKMLDLKNTIERFSARFKMDYILIEQEDKWSGIEGIINAEEVDIVSITQHKRNWLYSLVKPGIVKKMLFNARIPMMVFHQHSPDQSTG